MPLFEHAAKPLAEFHDWDPRFPEVVLSLQTSLSPFPTGVAIEHVGSTAIPGCGGKGVIDLLALYPEGGLEETKSWLLSLGVSRQGPEFSRAWPEQRPMYLGRYRHHDELFLVYIHVVSRGSDEVRRFRTFRDRLSQRPDLVAEYCRLKREILASGESDTDKYAVRKRPFMHQVLGADHALKG